MVHSPHIKITLKTLKKLLEKEPKLKEVKKIIVDQLVKAKIKPDQYRELNQEIEILKIATEAPHARRRSEKKEVKTEDLLERLVKPKRARTKKTAKPIEGVENVNPGMKPIKETYKKTPKVIRLD